MICHRHRQQNTSDVVPAFFRISNPHNKPKPGDGNMEICRPLSRSARLLSRRLTCPNTVLQPRYTSVFQREARRAASSKHPQGFVPPQKEELEELRERVQEFASTLNAIRCITQLTDSICLTQDARSQKKSPIRRTRAMNSQTTCGGRWERPGASRHPQAFRSCAERC